MSDLGLKVRKLKMLDQERLELIDLAKNVAQVGGSEALTYFRKFNLKIDDKANGSFDPVTEADIASEDKMRSYLKLIRPFDTIKGEERKVLEGSSEYTWVLDPIDGTRAFICGIPVWTVLVSLLKGNVPVLGVIYQPFTQEFFVGGFGFSEHVKEGSSSAISVRKCKRLNDAFLATTFPEIGNELERKAFEAVRMRVKLCRFGLDAYAYALLAAGHLDIIIEAGLKSYDILASIALIEAAGGVVSDWNGRAAINGGQVLACGDKSIHKVALDILSQRTDVTV